MLHLPLKTCEQLPVAPGASGRMDLANVGLCGILLKVEALLPRSQLSYQVL